MVQKTAASPFHEKLRGPMGRITGGGAKHFHCKELMKFLFSFKMQIMQGKGRVDLIVMSPRSQRGSKKYPISLRIYSSIRS